MMTYIVHVHDTDDINVLITAVASEKNDQKVQQVSSAIG